MAGWTPNIGPVAPARNRIGNRLPVDVTNSSSPLPWPIIRLYPSDAPEAIEVFRASIALTPTLHVTKPVREAVWKTARSTILLSGLL